MDEVLVSAIERLIEILCCENFALATLDLARVGSMLAEKQESTARFARAYAAGVDAVTPTLLALARRLDAAASENRLLLERGIVVQSRVLAVLAQAVPRAAGPRYGARGGAAMGGHAPLALSVRA